MATASQTSKPGTWFVVAIVFIVLFILLLLGAALVISYIYHHKKQGTDLNPYPYGSEDWLHYERATAAQAERDALVIAHLESRISVQEQYNQEADKMIDLLDRHQKHLTLQLRDEQRKSEPMDPQVFQRIYNDIHKPLQRPRPSLPPLLAAESVPAARPLSPTTPIVKSTVLIQPASLQPLISQPDPLLLQSTKLRGVSPSNSESSPARSSHIVEIQAPPPATCVDHDNVRSC